ncbi:MAG TPA: ABC transporter permease, partial [Candidatus Egerieousia sp.]|nr:ABC transporter permease [Candidatus Egerieousia sp.]
YMFIFMFGGMVMRGVIEEKNNRIIEVIVSSVKPVQLMIGKIVGVALVALTQFFIWILLTGIIVAAVMGVAGADTITNAVQSQSAVQQATAAAAQAGESMPSISSIFGMLGGMHIGGVLISFLIYFVLGYLLYSSMFAAVGSCVDNEADTQQLMLPITIPLIIGLFIMLSAFQAPNSSIAVWGSIIPFTSPMVMMARVSYGIGVAAGVPIWQYVLSIVLLVATFLVMAWLSGKIYRIGILSYGKKAGWKEIGKWLKFKD